MRGTANSQLHNLVMEGHGSATGCAKQFICYVSVLQMPANAIRRRGREEFRFLKRSA